MPAAIVSAQRVEERLLVCLTKPVKLNVRCTVNAKRNAVIISILGISTLLIIIPMVLPPRGMDRDAAFKSIAMSRMRMFTMAIYNYEEQHDSWPSKELALRQVESDIGPISEELANPWKPNEVMDIKMIPGAFRSGKKQPAFFWKIENSNDWLISYTDGAVFTSKQPPINGESPK